MNSIDKIGHLADLLNDNRDMFSEHYYQTKVLLEKGIYFPVKLYLPNLTIENVLLSLFRTYANELQFVRGQCSRGKTYLFEQDLLSIALIIDGQPIWQKQICLNTLSQEFNEDFLNNLAYKSNGSCLSEFSGQKVKVFLKLEDSDTNRCFWEKFSPSADEKMNTALHKLKLKLSQYCHDFLTNKVSEEAMIRIVHRLKLWGYELWNEDWMNPNFKNTVNSLNLHQLNFRDSIEIEELTCLLDYPLSNEQLLMEIEKRKARIQKDLDDMKNKLSGFCN